MAKTMNLPETGMPPDYIVERCARERDAYEVLRRTGGRIAKCATQRDAEKVARALNIAQAAARAAAMTV